MLIPISPFLRVLYSGFCDSVIRWHFEDKQRSSRDTSFIRAQWSLQVLTGQDWTLDKIHFLDWAIANCKKGRKTRYKIKFKEKMNCEKQKQRGRNRMLHHRSRKCYSRILSQRGLNVFKNSKLMKNISQCIDIWSYFHFIDIWGLFDQKMGT